MGFSIKRGFKLCEAQHAQRTPLTPLFSILSSSTYLPTTSKVGWVICRFILFGIDHRKRPQKQHNSTTQKEKRPICQTQRTPPMPPHPFALCAPLCVYTRSSFKGLISYLDTSILVIYLERLRGRVFAG